MRPPLCIIKVDDANKKVYLAKDAFGSTESTITISGTDNYQFAEAGASDTDYLKTYGDDNAITENLSGGTYTRAGHYAGVTFNDGDTKTSATYHKQDGGQQFTVTGLKNDLTVNNGKIYLSDGSTEVGEITVTGTTGTVKLINLAALANGGSADQNFSLTNTPITTSGADTDITYSFDFSGTPFNFLENASTAQHEAKFTPGNSSGEYKYSTAGADAYTSESSGTYTYHKKVEQTTITITGLTRLGTTTGYEVDGTAIKDGSSNTIANIVDVTTGEAPDTVTTKTIQLTVSALPTTEGGTTSISLSGSSDYALGLDAGVTSTAFTKDTTVNASISGNTFTAQKYLQYFTVESGIVKGHKAVGGDKFTITGVNNLLTTAPTVADKSGDTITTTAGDFSVEATVSDGTYHHRLQVQGRQDDSRQDVGH